MEEDTLLSGICIEITSGIRLIKVKSKEVEVGLAAQNYY